MSKLKATNPHQYDSSELDWHSSGAENSSSRTYLREEIGKVVEPGFLNNKKVLDIGSGVGQLFNWLKSNKAAKISGIDPSERNIQTTTQEYPWASSTKATLHEFATTSSLKFDAAFGIYVFEHIRDLKEAFADVRSLLFDGGSFYLIIGDKDYNLSTDKEARGSRFVSVKILQEFEDGTIETEIHRKNEAHEPIVMYDVFRPMENVREAAHATGFQIILEKEILGPQSTPPEQRKHTMCHLFVFTHQP